MMEKRFRGSRFMWMGSILIAVLVVSSLGFGMYRLYALGWARGAAAAQEGAIETVPPMPSMPMPLHRGHRMYGFPQVQTLAQRRGLHNVTAQMTDGVHLTGLPDDRVEVVLLCDVFHMLGDQTGVLKKIRRVLRPQ